MRCVPAFLALLLLASTNLAQDPPRDPAEVLAKILEEAKKEATRIRGLPFLAEIPVRKITKDDFRKLMFRDLRRVLGEGEDLRHMERLLQRLRVLPEGMGVIELTERFFPETVGANYDPFTRRISFLKMYRSRKTQKSVMVHELTHALQDQHFNLKDLVFSGELTFDRLLALGGLVEGDAENVQRTHQFGIQFAMAPIEMIRTLGEKEIERYLERMKGFPRGIARPFIFQYLDGLLFVETVKRARRGFPAVSRMYRDPPQSTEQVLHPEKYLDRDHPTRILVDPPEGCRILVSNVLGELGVSIVLEANLGRDYPREAARGWDGDRILLIETPGGSEFLAWFTTWDTAGDALEFAKAAKRMLTVRHPGATPDTEGEAWFLRDAKAGHALIVRGPDVLLLEGVAVGTPLSILEDLGATKETLVVKRGRFLDAGK